MTAGAALQFDANAARGIERIYATPDIVGQRARFLQLLAPKPGEYLLDVGMGPGFLTYELAPIVGERGLVAGVDSSEVMVELARKRCDGRGPCEFKLGSATELPFGDANFDAVTSTQVYEYVADMERALAEVRRVLRPGGRVFILDTDWDSVVWNTREPARMRRVMDAWDEHLHDPHLPAKLGPLLTRAGFALSHIEVIPIVNASLHANCYSDGMVGMIASFVVGRGGVTQEEARAWAAELRALGAADEYFFSINRYAFGARKR
ncbi:MAG TPA: methyltransferase domain-containing protein [Myxococcota bacterium]